MRKVCTEPVQRFAVQVLMEVNHWVYVVDTTTLEPQTYETWDEAEQARSIWKESGSRVVAAPN